MKVLFSILSLITDGNSNYRNSFAVQRLHNICDTGGHSADEVYVFKSNITDGHSNYRNSFAVQRLYNIWDTGGH